MLKSLSLTFSTITEPSKPALFANWRKGASNALATRSAATFSSALVRLSLYSATLEAK